MARKKASASDPGAAPAATPAAPRAPALQFTVFTSTDPERLTKVLSLNTDGTLKKQAAANMMQGTAHRAHARGLEELAALLDALTPAQAVGWGICTQEQATIAAERDVQASQAVQGDVNATTAHSTDGGQ